MGNLGKRILVVSLLVLGALALAVAASVWGACWVSSASAACLSASDRNAGMAAATLLWMLAVWVYGIALFPNSTRVGAVIGVGILLVVNPLTDPGFFWAFDSADSTPGRGVIGAFAILVAGLVLAKPREARMNVGRTA